MIRTRFRFLGVLSIAGAVLYLPFARYAMPGGLSFSAAAAFVLASSVVSLAAIWYGLRTADATGLPMPVLRTLESGERPRRPSVAAVASTTVAGLLVAATAVFTQRALGMPNPPAPAWAKILSVLFAAVTLETVLHLFGMGVLMRISRRAWVAVLGSGLLLGVFHLTGAASLDRAAIVIACVNAAAGVLFGWLYWAFGFEYLIVGHAVAHVIAVLLT